MKSAHIHQLTCRRLTDVNVIVRANCAEVLARSRLAIVSASHSKTLCQAHLVTPIIVSMNAGLPLELYNAIHL